MKIYLDNCCYNRPFDGYTDDRSVDEVTAIKAIVEICKSLGYAIIGSPVVARELDKARNKKPRKWALMSEFYISTINSFIELTQDIAVRAQEFMTVWPKEADCYHLALAEAAFADFLLTTDDGFENANARLSMSIVNVINPIRLLQEMRGGNNSDRY